MSDKRSDASRKNGSLSNGPKTPEGKAISSQNAVKCGFFAANPVLPSESKQEFQAFREGLLRSFAPVGEVEELLAERLIGDSWRMLRIPQIEAGMFAVQICEEQSEHALKQARELEERGFWNRKWNFDTPEEKIAFEKLRASHMDAHTQINDPENALGLAFLRDSQASAAFTRLMRYEAMLQRNFNRNLQELRRLQAERAAAQVIQKPKETKVQNEPDSDLGPRASGLGNVQNEPEKGEDRPPEPCPGDLAA